jgi:hypothetical protein
MSTQKALDALRGICILSNSGAEGVDREALGSFLGIAAATAPLNNNYFQSVGLVESAGRGLVKPTELAMKFQRDWSFNKARAAHLLAPALRDSWFYDATVKRVEMGETTRDALIQVFANIAQTDATYSVQLGNLIEWLETVGLIEVTDGIVHLADTGGSSVDAPSDGQRPIDELPDPGDAETEKEDFVETPDPRVRDRVLKDRQPAVISLSVDVYVTADDLARLTADQITALFTGAAQLATVNAALAQPE